MKERPTTPCCLCGTTTGYEWAEDARYPQCTACAHVCCHDGQPFRWAPMANVERAEAVHAYVTSLIGLDADEYTDAELPGDADDLRWMAGYLAGLVAGLLDDAAALYCVAPIEYMQEIVLRAMAALTEAS